METADNRNSYLPCISAISSCLVLSVVYVASLYVWNSPHNRYATLVPVLLFGVDYLAPRTFPTLQHIFPAHSEMPKLGNAAPQSSHGTHKLTHKTRDVHDSIQTQILYGPENDLTPALQAEKWRLVI